MKKNFQGFTLVEMILGLSLALLVTSIIISIYLAAEKNFRLQTVLSNIQENARTAMSFLDSDLSMAGYMGCAKLTDDFPITSTTPFSLKNNNKILIEGNTRTNSITVIHANVDHADLTRDMITNSVLYTSLEPVFKQDDILIISNCKSADIFQVKNIINLQNEQKIIPQQELSTLYDKNSEVSKLQINKYYIADTLRGPNAHLYALYMTDMINRHTLELVENIDAMKIAKTENGLQMKLIFSSVDHSFPLKKTWNYYVALRD